MYSGETTFTRMEVDSHLIAQGFIPGTTEFLYALRLIYEPTGETGIYVERHVPVVLTADEYTEIQTISTDRALLDLYEQVRTEQRLCHSDAVTIVKRLWHAVDAD